MSTEDLVQKILERGRGLIKPPKQWGKGAYKRYTQHGVQYCSVGALREARSRMIQEMPGRYRDIEDAYSTALRRLGKATPLTRIGPSMTRVIEFNDHATHDQVLAAWDKAVKS